MHRRLPLLPVLCLLALPGASLRAQDEDNVETAVPVPAHADTDIRDAVEDEIVADHAVRLTGIDVAVSDGVVSLTGRVPDLLQRERAVRIAETVTGVRAVVDRLTVDPVGQRTDREIAADVREALLADPAAEFFDVAVEVEDARVTLTGTVQSWPEKRLCGDVARHVRGVEALRNRLTIEYPETRSGDEILADVRQSLRWNVRVDHALVDVAVDAGRVTLTGTVGSAAEKSEAIRNAWVVGVTEVDAEGLEVARWARDPDLRAGKYADVADEELRDAIRRAWIVDPRVYSFDLAVEVDDGVVTLRGVVDNLKAKRAAQADARNTVGVHAVRNRIRVRSGPEASDPALARAVRQALARDPWVDRYEMTVEVRDGIAYLSGAVDSWFEKAQADDIASRVEDVVDVVNKLDVAFDTVPHPYDPYVDPWLMDDYSWYRWSPDTVPTEPDAVILDRIGEEFFWSPFVDSDGITVTVEDGVATLTGTVDSYTESAAARRNAYEAGATYVRNRLTVE